MYFLPFDTSETDEFEEQPDIDFLPKRPNVNALHDSKTRDCLSMPTTSPHFVNIH